MDFQKAQFSLLAVHVMPDYQKHLKKMLKEEWYLFNGWYKLKNNALVKRKELKCLLEGSEVYGRLIRMMCDYR